ncbi:hypothetical protein [Sphingomonas aquatilis]|uniref:Type IV secretory pathway VirB10-like protein n=1 Tax=Sphingomonas aquatilis TaxID=93063 RepID=A0AAW3TSD0_9SPHN|nr:hypothetical protein [Sphingomonas aquatilis]MBB3875986.1 type IV secretory pathway VirB10-like protein [Sphingomonas aquatilis]MCI4655250.1 hypothetical protein [Sphingomonas aquatilis]GEM70272.1 hypothetical protein SAQ01S_00380 [Sphingomonas aquatilis NBRC 16722]
MARKLKVFRTPIGFHDAYVAAPSQKAALQAWGTETDLFARGVAEQVTDAALMEEPLAHPGDVIRKTRGTVDDHMAALPANPKRKPPDATDAPPAKPRRTKPKPRPSRSKLDQAEQAIEEAEQRYDVARRDLAAREAALRKERQALENDRDRERERLETARADQERRYREAMAAWRDGEAD